jgi:hypothetical protein
LEIFLHSLWLIFSSSSQGLSQSKVLNFDGLKLLIFFSFMN